ncbi:MAG: Holliday junction branch migration protein RuvA [Lentisphaeria bacterium]|nr:Holliday junction branch migration protein RuvA [Lentisphaerota bacterium]MBR2626315.1 Holliday junction branch migration protein RuvA [Lentisphaeria bacterium]
MIGMLSGRVVEKDFSSCLIDVNGVGYEVLIPLSTFDKLPLENENITLYIHTAVREDAITLFGFAGKDEKQLFQQLINVSGVGGKLALNVLSAMPASSFCAAVSSGDVKSLSRINGVGKRTAERLIVELKGKLAGIDPAAAPPVSGSAAADACAALEQLGFRKDAVNKTVNALLAELPEKECTVENLIRTALLKLNF